MVKNSMVQITLFAQKYAVFFIISGIEIDVARGKIFPFSLAALSPKLFTILFPLSCGM